MLGNQRMIRTMRLRRFLSYGPDSEEIKLESLNVFIGPNASGKSNLIDALSLLQAAPHDLTNPIRGGGGVGEWLWKGEKNAGDAEIEVTADYAPSTMPLRYRLVFSRVGQGFELVDEVVENEQPYKESDRDVYFFYRYQHGNPILNTRLIDENENAKPRTVKRFLNRKDMDLTQSVLSQRKDRDLYPELTWLGSLFSKIRLYREWNLGRKTPPRIPQSTDMAADFLEEDARNLSLVLNDLENRANTKQVIIERLKSFCESYQDITTKISGGTIQIYLHEKGLKHPVPATRLSDGTIRYLCLLTILCHPEPPPVVCIEEPELGLHPDVIPTLAEMLIEASCRTQLFVTTHSDILVSALTDVPESVIVCEKDSGGSSLRRLDKEQLREWLEKYTLGELWRMGELGGNPA